MAQLPFEVPASMDADVHVAYEDTKAYCDWAGAVLPTEACAFPLSVLPLGLGVVPIAFHREHLALHDLIAGTAAAYDWGERPAELPGRCPTSSSEPTPRATRPNSHVAKLRVRAPVGASRCFRRKG
jgi:hypothetical protein